MTERVDLEALGRDVMYGQLDYHFAERVNQALAELRRLRAMEADEPPLALLISMATRCDHGFAMNSHRAQQVALSDMRRCWEEMTGRGFYHGNDAMYLSVLRPEGDPGELDWTVLTAPPAPTPHEGTVTAAGAASPEQGATGPQDTRGTPTTGYQSDER